MLSGSKIAVANPRGTNANVGEVRPRLAIDPVGVRVEIDLLEAIELGSSRLVGEPFELNSLVVVPTDHERDPRISPEILHFSRRAERVEHDLEAIADPVTDYGRLGHAVDGHRRLHAEPTLTKEDEELGEGHDILR